MFNTTLQLFITVVLFVHGVGHVLGIMAALQLANVDGWSSDSWLLNGILGERASRAISFLLFLAALIGFIGAVLALMGWLLPHEWWRPMSVISAVISLIALGLFWNAFPSFFPNKVGAIAVNIVVLVGILLMDWPTEAAIGY
jgi:hypothetical protein